MAVPGDNSDMAAAPAPLSVEDRLARMESMITNFLESQNHKEGTAAASTTKPFSLFGDDTSERKASLRPNAPMAFSGERSKGRAFLYAIRTYVRLVPESFYEHGEPSEEKVIRFALSYMSEGAAQRWAECHGSSEELPWYTWNGFVADFKLRFVEENEQDHAIASLESRDYFMKGRDVFTYTDDFEDLYDISGFSDALVKVTKYRSGLDPAINHAITTSGNAPELSNYEGWRKRSYAQYEAKVRAKSIFGTAPSAPRSSTTAPTCQTGVIPRARLAAPAFVPAAAPAPVPMEIDRSRARTATPRSCFRCGEPGHIARDCPTTLDVRTIDVLDEVIYQLGGEMMEELVARMDSARVAEEHAAEVAKAEDFLQCGE